MCVVLYTYNTLIYIKKVGISMKNVIAKNWEGDVELNGVKLADIYNWNPKNGEKFNLKLTPSKGRKYDNQSHDNDGYSE